MSDAEIQKRLDRLDERLQRLIRRLLAIIPDNGDTRH